VIKRLTLIILLLCAAALPLFADDAPQFLIERIDVRSAKHVSRDVVVAESRLREGLTYNELDLREASDRVNRAPYLVSADFSLEKGSERGKYVLVISVNETKPFFYRFELVPLKARRDDALRVDVADSPGTSENEVAVGFRFFTGRRGAVHFGLSGTSDNRSYTNDYSFFVAGYTQYDLFGSRAFATLNLKKPIASFPSEHSSITPQLVLGIPLSPNQTLTLDYDDTNVERRSRFPYRTTQRIVMAKWSYNTTNHPLLPTRGTLITVMPLAVWLDRQVLTYVTLPGELTEVRTHTRSFALEGSASRYWQLDDVNSWSAGIEGGLARTTLHEAPVLDRAISDSRFARLNLGFAHSFWSSERVAKEGDSRIDVDLRITSRDDPYQRLVHLYEPISAYQLSASWVRRNAWGTFRIGAGVAW